MRLPLIRSIRTAKRRPIPARRRRAARHPALEGLEDRLCPSGYLLVDSFDNNSVLRYDEGTGAFVDAFIPTQSGGLREPDGIVFGPDHNLYVSGGVEPDKGTGHKDVLRYDGTTGAFMDDFADSNELQSPRAILFGPDGNLYVADGLASAVVRYDGTTGAFLDDFVPSGSGGLYHPVSMVFGPDGQNDGKLDLYVGCVYTNTILRYDGTTGAFKGVFVPAGTGGLATPQGMVFGPDGDLYVSGGSFASTDPGSVLRFEGPSAPNPGAFIDAFVPAGSSPLNTPDGLLFGPDANQDGHLDLYVTSALITTGSDSGKLKLIAAPGTSEVLRYDGTTGAFLDTFVTPDSGGLNLPLFMTFTETDPMTLNYDGAPPSLAPSATVVAPAPASPVQFGLGTLDQAWWDPSAQARAWSPAPAPPYQLLDLALANLAGLPRHTTSVNVLTINRPWPSEGTLL